MTEGGNLAICILKLWCSSQAVAHQTVYDKTYGNQYLQKEKEKKGTRDCIL